MFLSVSDLALSLSSSSSRRSGSVSGPSSAPPARPDPPHARSSSLSRGGQRQPRNKKKKKSHQNDSSPDLSGDLPETDSGSSRRSSTTSAPAGAVYSGGDGRKVIRSHLDTSKRLHAIDFPMQFNFGSPYGASVNIMFDQ